MSQPSTPAEALDEVCGMLKGEPVFVVGSCVAADQYGLAGFSDVDVFTPSQGVLFTTVQLMLDRGCTIDDRFDRVWYRWKKYGFKGWHTNSMKLHTSADTPINVVLKMQDGHPTTSLSQVVEGFDFGLLGMGYDMESNRFMDFKPVLFPGMDISGELPLMPAMRDTWTRGFISKHRGLREGDRYARYVGYGHPMGAVAMDLVEGYRNAALYHVGREELEHQHLAVIYTAIADHIEYDKIDELRQSYSEIRFDDPLDEIMEAMV